MSGEAKLAAAIRALARLRRDESVAWVLSGLTDPQLRAVAEQWDGWAHGGQRPRRDDWRVWMMMAGRGFGKTRAGAEWVSALARADGRLKIALVAATIDEAVKVMVRGRSGLMAVARAEEDLLFVPSAGMVTFASGAQAFVYSGSNPDKLRGPEHHYAWCDELAKWRYPEESWTNLLLGLRLGEDPRALVTTPPRPIALLREIAADPATLVTRGATGDNVHLPRAFVADMERRYGGTLLGRQELDGLIVEEVEGALWTRAGIEAARIQLLPELARGGGPPPQAVVEGPPAEPTGTRRGTAPLARSGALPPAAAAPPPCSAWSPSPACAGEDFLTRVVIGVDPPASADGDACGIVACGLGTDGIGYVLGDHSVRGAAPEGWAAAVAGAAVAHGADKVVAEANNGGAMVKSVLLAADCALPVRLVHASRGKAARAEPVAALFANGRARFAGRFKELEAELCGIAAAGRYGGPGRSPDRADAMVWAMTELMLGRRGAPAVRGL